jgi:uncharacterized RmlC-like cupin family protein
MGEDGALPVVIRPGQITPDLAYEPPLRVGFGINADTVPGARAVMGRTVLVPGAGPNPRHYHADIDVCWHILAGQIRLSYARQDGSGSGETVLCAGDFVYIPAGAIHIIANASATEEASLVFCYIGVGTVEAARTVWLDRRQDRT